MQPARKSTHNADNIFVHNPLSEIFVQGNEVLILKGLVGRAAEI